MTIREKIKNIPLVGHIAKKVVNRLQAICESEPKRPPNLNPSFWIPQILTYNKGVAVQIGSNDGITGDPLHNWLKSKKGWSAVFVEPVPFLFERLQKTYSEEERFTFENSVINDGSEVTFYWVSEDAGSAIPDLPSWFDQLGGFSREHIIKHIPELEPFIKSIKVTGVGLMDLFERHGLTNVDLLHIDTEGADYRILSQLDLKRFRPRVILFERKHLSEAEEGSAIRFLQETHELFNLGADFLAVDRETADIQSTLLSLRSMIVQKQ